MDKKNQGSIRQIVSLVAVVAVLGYIGSYGPSVVNWWEETWYPHGREPRVIQPGTHPDPIVSTNPMSEDADGQPSEFVGELPMMAPEYYMPPPVAQSSGSDYDDDTVIEVEDADGCYAMPDFGDYWQPPIAQSEFDPDDPAGV